MNVPSLNLILAHTIGTLPDSFSERKKLLAAALELMPEDHPLRLQVGEMFHWLIAHEEHQLHLAIDLGKSIAPEPPTTGSGETGK